MPQPIVGLVALSQMASVAAAAPLEVDFLASLTVAAAAAAEAGSDGSASVFVAVERPPATPIPLMMMRHPRTP